MSSFYLIVPDPIGNTDDPVACSALKKKSCPMVCTKYEAIVAAMYTNIEAIYIPLRPNMSDAGLVEKVFEP